MNKYKKGHGAGCLFIAAILLIIPVFIFIGHVSLQDRNPTPNDYEQQSVSSESSEFETVSSSYPSGKAIYSRNAILICLDDNAILMQKNSNEKIYPASLTKMMTAIVAIENIKDFQTKVTLPESIFHELKQSDASLAGFEPDEAATANDLLYGVLLPSGAECCIGLADYIAGSEQNFVKLMNQKAVELGMDNTYFVNSTGLQNKNHFTTVSDLGVLLRYALKNQTFRKIFTSQRYTVSPTNRHPKGFGFRNTMFEKLKNPSISGGKILGGKTGYTNQAGLCLASLAKENGKEYILITAEARGSHETEQYDIDDALTIYNGLTNSAGKEQEDGSPIS